MTGELSEVMKVGPSTVLTRQAIADPGDKRSYRVAGVSVASDK
jgi:hypothetical protein